MKRSLTHRVAAIAAVGVAAIGGSTAAWLGIDSASGSQPAASGTNLTFTMPFIIYCSSNPEQVSTQMFVGTPDGTIQYGPVSTMTCQNNPLVNPAPITVSAAPAGTYEIGIEASTPGSVYFFQPITPEVTNSSGVVVSASVVNGTNDNSQHVQVVSPFVYSPKLFKLGQS